MKKLLCAGFAVVFASAFLFAQNAAPAFSKGKKPGVDKEVKEMMELVQKYQKETSAKKKAKIEVQVKEKVAANYDKHIANMEERLTQAEKRLAESKAKLGGKSSGYPDLRAESPASPTLHWVEGQFETAI